MDHATTLGAHRLPAAATASHRPSAAGAYHLRLAASDDDVRACQALRFEVFNLELDEGLVDAYDTGLDADDFDAVCEHLMVECAGGGGLVGTYRLQTGLRAAMGLGWYSAQAFDLAALEPWRAQTIELGRACVHRAHRNFTVLNLLWCGIADHAAERGARYLIGCSSLTSQDEGVGAATWRALQPVAEAPPAWRVQPRAGWACALDAPAAAAPAVPRLLSMYLALGARLCGPPAIDRAFRTIDFFTWLDTQATGLQALRARGRFVPAARP